MTTRNIAFLTGLCAAVLLGASAVSQSVDVGASAELAASAGTRAINLGLATQDMMLDVMPQDMLLDGRTALFSVPESGQSRDLNGDGDQNDSIMHVFDATSGRVRNLRLSIAGNLVLQGGVFAFFAREDTVDLNGDGDVNDVVLHVYDTERGSLLNLRLASREFSGLFTDGRRLAFCVEESSQGKDLNQDGDTDDQVAHIFDLQTNRVLNMGLAVQGVGPENLTLGGRWMAIGVFEGLTFTREDGTMAVGVDLNGNGLVGDTVLHLFDTATGRVKNLRLPLGAFRFGEPDGFEFGFNVGGGAAMLAVSENRQGVDLNGDNDIGDVVLHRIDLASGRVVNTRIAAVSAGQDNVFPSLSALPSPFAFQEGLAVFNLSEPDEGKDFNGDGDRMCEVNKGKDLNGDGDIRLDEFVMALADFSGDEPRIVSTGLAVTFLPGDNVDFQSIPTEATAFQIRGNLVTFAASEERQGNRDLNGDGDSIDTVLHIADLSTMTTLNTRLSAAPAYRSRQAPLLPASDGLAVVPLREARQGNRDLNRDGDTADTVLQILDVRSGRSRNTGVAVAADELLIDDFLLLTPPLMIRGETFVSLLLDEDRRDLNGDGDTADRVLHILDIATGRLTNLGRAVASSGFPESERDLAFDFVGLSVGSGALSGFVGPSVTTSDGPGLGDAYTFIVSEADQGNVDLNGDGDTDDKVVYATRLTDRDRNGRFDFTEGRD